MANLRNEFEFRSALLTALGQEHTEAEAKNEDTWRRKMLDGLGVEYNQNDVNQFGLFREKLIEGITNKSEESGGGGSSDFSTANVTLTVGTTVNIKGVCIATDDEYGEYLDTAYQIQSADPQVITAVLYKGNSTVKIQTQGTLNVSGNIQQLAQGVYNITGDCTITIS